ncbi:MAG: FAD-dependent oxidoreductase [Methanocellales archaeon]|nr:FAD-dependent oxidoreductase [Methanocellales archaeon]
MSELAIIGGGLAGALVASYVREKDPDMSITLFTKDRYVAYSPRDTPFVLSGDIASFEDLMMHDFSYYKDKGIDLRIDTEITAIDLENKSVIVEGERRGYDQLVIATGVIPDIPQIPGIDKRGVFFIKGIEDGKKVKEAMKSAKNAVVAGADPVSLEIASAFLTSGINTTVVASSPYVLPQYLDPDMAVTVQNKLESLGMRVITGSPLGSINGPEYVEFVTVGKEIIPADLVILSPGAKPNANLAKQAGIKIGETGGIQVDPSMHVTKSTSVYAAGGCVEVIHHITARPTLSMLGGTAIQQARVVAENICGGDATFDPVVNPAVSVIAGLQVGSVGLTSHAAKQAGLAPIEGRAQGLTRAHCYPGAKKIHIKLLFAEERLIGAQIISEEGVKERIDTLSFLIKSGVTYEQLRHIETCYAPPVSSVVDVLTLALETLKR